MGKRGQRLVVQPGQMHVYVAVKDSDPASKPVPEFVKFRYVFAVFGFMLLAIIYGLKVNLSVAMVGMRNVTAEESNPLNITQSDCAGDLSENRTIEDGPFEWGQDIKGVILSSYFFGYLVSQVPGGRVAEVFSAKWILFASVALNIVATILTPLAAKLHWSVLILLRIIEGVGGGFSFPAVHVMISKWSPFEERSLISSVIYAGTAVGTVLSLLFTGLIVQYINWEAPFYIMGSLAIIWCVPWCLLMTDSPRTNRFISEAERDYIISSVGECDESEEKPPVPWRQVWTSPPFYAILICHTLSNFAWYMLLIEAPLYYDQVLKISMKKVAIYSSLPFFTLWIFALILSSCQSVLIRKKLVTVTLARKVATLCASVVPAVCLVVVNFAACNEELVFAFFGIGTTFMGGMFSGFLSNHIDIAPQFAGTLMGITNTVSTLPGIVVPIFIGQLTKTEHTRDKWSIIFYTIVGFLAIEAVIYTVFGSGEEQPWNNPSRAHISEHVEQKDTTENVEQKYTAEDEEQKDATQDVEQKDATEAVEQKDKTEDMGQKDTTEDVDNDKEE